MTTKELNDHIKNYLEDNKTSSAIMLTGEWGCGKSYYIQNELIPFLRKDGKNRCVVVSLYGIKTVEDLSKSIFMEIKTKILNRQSEKLETTKILAKTVLKGIISYFGIDLSANDKDLNKLYRSIDLTGRLIILEDLERSSMSILEIMGYVNNLVEQDGVKILLVANEREILKEEKHSSTSNITLPDEVTSYIKIKEKTISETIPFSPEIESAINNILKMFDYEYFNKCLNHKEIKFNEEIMSVMQSVGIVNLRAFIFACQKTKEMFQQATPANSTIEFDLNFFMFVFLGNVAFSLRLSKNTNLIWDNDALSPIHLGTYTFPLQKFSYDYIKSYSFILQSINDTEKFYLEKKAIEEKQTNIRTYLNTLYNFHISDEQTLTKTVEQILINLQNDNSNNLISYIEYSKLANYLICVKDLINDGNYVDACKTAMVNNLKNHAVDDKVINQFALFKGIPYSNSQKEQEFQEFISLLIKTIHEKKNEILTSDKSGGNIDTICDNILGNKNQYLIQHAFAKFLDINHIIDSLKNATAAKIQNFRETIASVYSFENIKDFFAEDINTLRKLYDGVADIIKSNKAVLDKIQKLQLEWLKDNLDNYMEKLT